MKRRKFFIGTGALATVSLISIGSFNYWLYSDEDDIPVHNPFIQDFLSEEILSTIIEEHLETNQGIRNFENKTTEMIRSEIMNDFKLDNLKIRDGWVLSDTEIDFLIQQKK